MSDDKVFRPRVFQAREDGTTALETSAGYFRVVWSGPEGVRLLLGSRVVTEDFLRYTRVLSFSELL